MASWNEEECGGCMIEADDGNGYTYNNSNDWSSAAGTGLRCAIRNCRSVSSRLPHTPEKEVRANKAKGKMQNFEGGAVFYPLFIDTD